MEFNFFGKELYINKGILTISILVFIILLVFCGYRIGQDNKPIIIESKQIVDDVDGKEEQMSIETNENDSTDSNKAKSELDEIKVYVVGCVKNPGIVNLKKGQLINDAIEAAGGATEDADLENINLVYSLKENVMLKINSKNSENLGQKQNTNSVSAAGKGIVITSDSGGSIISGNQSSKNSKVNINTANIEELTKLSGVGEATANKIIKFREENGEYKKIEEIMNVPGIGESKFAALKDFITAN